jgi:hypothetical protein
VRGAVFVKKTIPNKGQECHPRCKVLEELFFENLIIDFTEMPWTRGYNYLLVFVCIFSGWVEVEAFLT